MINARRDQANALRGEAMQQCEAAFIDARDVEDEIYGFAIADLLLAARLSHLDAGGGNLARDYDPRFVVADFFFYSKHIPASALQRPFVISWNFQGFAFPRCRKHRHQTDKSRKLPESSQNLNATIAVRNFAPLVVVRPVQRACIWDVVQETGVNGSGGQVTPI
jgi:hypothetical protein